ncbi:MAG: anaerobic ribonucleoside-triphosphate reductase activating protein [Bacillota bacterium]|uniref:Anaerobic ribonucleoside-triphosphate reductase-activating protein n=1 Tax=Thermanaerosceptrum fracticalcis TaxID=1712410 RepID=A0A7G6DZ57_THEFR|nr:anaerobic ribonucleoside-triphosphate reductase activating protein [Thermanaerosceptrum fracticalcis]QNB45111.1 anaerobic ribonucleoside-triphosphate reductase activating protein [Thermanaerosceptrum fracticalcis]
MRLSGIISESVVDGPGVRFVVFTQGCPHHCPGCHNPETWDPSGGKEMTLKEILKLIKKKLKNIRGITLSGGDPFLQAAEMAALAREAKKLGLDVVTYTGYTYEELLAIDGPGFKELLEVTDILVDGPFLIQYRDIGLAFRGSSNQRVIDLAATKEKGQLILIA